jgi:hypothetical protein
VTLDLVRDEACYRVQLLDLETPLAAGNDGLHIHGPLVGANATADVFAVLPVGAPSAYGAYAGCMRGFGTAKIAAILANPALFYLAAHTEAPASQSACGALLPDYANKCDAPLECAPLPAGCDGIAGSGARVDVCGVCGGTGSTCRVPGQPCPTCPSSASLAKGPATRPPHHDDDARRGSGSGRNGWSMDVDRRVDARSTRVDVEPRRDEAAMPEKRSVAWSDDMRERLVGGHTLFIALCAIIGIPVVVISIVVLARLGRARGRAHRI